MLFRRPVTLALLFTVLLAPVLSLAICAGATPAKRHACCCGKAEKMAAKPMPMQHGQPAAPCCERRSPQPAMDESAALVVPPVQLALLPALEMYDAPWLGLMAEAAALAPSPTSQAPPLERLCTLLI